ncbi:MAG: DUF2283 domain-containing protein [Actinobacteria bacterium]|nr:DUF2283 domain-containing protein [Actinomycetota bacterium]
MEISYDKKYNIAYIKIRNKTVKVKTVKISDELNVDISSEGKIYGIEFLNANKQLRIGKSNKIIFIDKSSGKKTQIPIAS